MEGKEQIPEENPGQKNGLRKNVSKFRYKWQTLSLRHKSLFVLVPLLLIAVALPLTIKLAQMQQNARSQAEALNFYVAANGSDQNNGSIDFPWLTIQKAANSAPAGATILIRTGTYQGSDIRRSNLTFTAYPGEKPVVLQATRNSALRVTPTWNGTTPTPTHDITISGLTIKGCYATNQCTSAQTNYGGILVEANSSNVLIENNTIQDNKSYGIRVYDSPSVTIRNNDIFQNETGVQIDHASGNVLIENNKIHDQNRMIVDTPCAAPGDKTCNDDYGAEGLGLGHVTGQVTIRGNQIWNNRAHSYDYIEDGGGMDIFGGTGPFLIENNTFHDEDTGLETGQQGPSDPNPAGNITFRRNTGWNLRTGLILRAAKDSLIANNTFYGFGDYKLLDGSLAPGQYGALIYQGTDHYAGSIENLQVLNNIVVTKTAEVYQLGTLPVSVKIDYNVIYNLSGGNLSGSIKTIEGLRTAKNIEKSGIQADPKFIDVSANNFGLSSGSPAIDKGVVISGTTDGFSGVAPDMGALEFGSSAPTSNPLPSDTPTITSLPTLTPAPTLTPTTKPTVPPTFTPTLTPKPTVTKAPTQTPTLTLAPTIQPTSAPTPTLAPTPIKNRCFKFIFFKFCF